MAKQDTITLRVIDLPFKWGHLITMGVVLLSLIGINTQINEIYNLSVFTLWLYVGATSIRFFGALIECKDNRIEVWGLNFSMIFLALIILTLVASGHWVKATLLLPWLFFRGCLILIKLAGEKQNER